MITPPSSLSSILSSLSLFLCFNFQFNIDTEGLDKIQPQSKKMSEPVVKEETTPNTKLPSSSTAVNATAPIALVDRDSLMMMDLDGSWTFDQIFTSDPTSPFLHQPFSPLWAFPDDNDAGNVTSTLAEGVRLSDYSKLIPPCKS